MKECPKCRHCYGDEVEFCSLDNVKPVPTIEISTTLSGRYILESRLGQGGMGIVFRAKHKFLKSYHAVKVILPSLVANDANLLVRFNQEAVLAASIDHPNVIRVTDFGIENDDMPFLVMEFIDGLPLSNHLKQGNPLAVRNALEIFIPIAQAVAAAHRKGIVHRDLKPENVMVQKNLPLVKAIKVLDFGLAKIKSGDSYPSLIQAKTMSIVGSPPYMSPEQWTGDGVDHRTDIYALSAMLFQMLTGRLPFQADSMPAMMYQHLSGTLPTADSLGVSFSPAIEAVVQKGMQKSPDDRYESMDIMLAALGDALASSGSSFSGEQTAVMPPSLKSSPLAKPVETLSDSQKERFYSYFDSQEKPEIIADPQLAQDFLDAQDKIESAKTEAVNSDLLFQELAEAERQAEEAQNKAIQAKQRIEADVRRQVEAEMQRLAANDQAKNEAEAERLAREVNARREAEERAANHLARAALEAQQLAENERKQREEEAQQRELHEGVRRQAEIEAQRLAVQVAESRKQYEDAKNEAAREAQFRADAEAKQRKIEGELQAVAATEAERRQMIEVSAKKFIEEQSEKYEKEALAAKQRLDEAKGLIELEAEKREQAEAARIHAEEEAERLSQEIIEVQRQMHEMQQHITSDSHTRSVPPHRVTSQGSIRTSASSLSPLNPDATSRQMPSILLKTGQFSNMKVMGALAIGFFTVLVLAAGGIGFYMFVLRPTPVSIIQDTNSNAADTSVPTAPKIERILITVGTFKMGRDDVPDRSTNSAWFDQWPANSVQVESFLIDKYETTNAQYAEFIKETKGKPPGDWDGQNPPTGKESFPVTNVTLADAMAYATWITIKEKKKCTLPTEAEWEYAARNGTQATFYPWGTDWRPDAAILSGTAVAVGTSNDETLSGVKDMLGNVTEWTSDVYTKYKGSTIQLTRDEEIFVIRGLNFKPQTTKQQVDLFKRTEFMLTYRNNMKKTDAKNYLGFRLVCSP